MRAEIKALRQRLKTTAIDVTHDQIEAMTMGDRIVVMNQRRIEHHGRPLDLYDRPATRNVAEFIGSPSMNILRVTVVDHDSALSLQLAGGEILPMPAGQGRTGARTRLTGNIV